MHDLAGLRVAVAGSGVLGLCCAVALARAGARVSLSDPGELGDNASGVAAGMLAPAMEAVLDPVSQGHFALYREARDAWPAFLTDVEGVALDRSGSLWVAADEGEAAAMLARLEAVGAAAELMSPDAAMALSPGLAATAPCVFTPDDWRLEPALMLDALVDAFETLGGYTRRGRVWVSDDGPRLDDQRALQAEVLVIAAGMPDAGLLAAAPELCALTPIKGQIVRAAGGAMAGPVVRARGVYIAPSRGEAVIGATMEPGLVDRDIDPVSTRSLIDRAAALYPGIAGAKITARAGVRAATPDGLPLVGPSATPGVSMGGGRPP